MQSGSDSSKLCSRGHKLIVSVEREPILGAVSPVEARGKATGQGSGGARYPEVDKILANKTPILH